MLGLRRIAELDRNRWWLRYLAILAAVVVAVAVAWKVTGRRHYDVAATITLEGGSCATHRSQCAKLADGGTVAVYGGSSVHRTRLHGAVTHVRFTLAPGQYVLAFPASRYSILVTDLTRSTDGEDGGFIVGKGDIDLGTVRPSAQWIYEGD
jgi:hypothetical protein